ncbi:hypothetical protein OF83DRAFT_1177585 [Amylostereum chailletii]|nr:hypothetical protein OF83DRAFT_1177585 [Amylostereum chailletii]
MSSTTLDLPASYFRALANGEESRLAALCALVYDQILTFDVEVRPPFYRVPAPPFLTKAPQVEFVWKMRKRSWAFWLYIFNRIVPLIWLAIDTGPAPISPHGQPTVELPRASQPRFFLQICFLILTMDNIVVILTTLSVQAILQMRIYALYNQNKTLRAVLAICCATELALMTIFHGVSMARLAKSPIIPTPTGCYYSGISLFPALFWIPSIVFEPVLCGLVVWKAWGERAMHGLKHKMGYGARLPLDRQVPNLWLDARPESFQLLAQDSLLYFSGIFIELMINVVVWAHYNHYVNIVYPWATSIGSILGSRLFLHMRQNILKPREESDTIALQTF